ncbi:transposase [Nocardia sp. NPDC050193]
MSPPSTPTRSSPTVAEEIAWAALRSRSAVWPHASHRKTRTSNASRTLALAERDASIVGPETMPDHVRLPVTCDPLFGIHRPAEQIEGRSSRVRAAIPVARVLPTWWTNSYFVATVGGATSEVVNLMSRTRRTYDPDSAPHLKAGMYEGSSR